MSRDIGMRLRHARKLRGMSQAQLAQKAGVKQAAISQLETGDSQSFRGTTLIACAQILDVRPAWLAEGKGPMEQAPQQIPSEAHALVREWLKLGPEARSDVLRLVKTMVRTSSADKTAVPDEKVAAAYGKPGKTRG